MLHSISSNTGLRKVDEIVLGAQGPIEFLNIPGNFRHLTIEAYLRGVSANNEEQLRLRFNNDTSTVASGGYTSVLNATESNVNDVAGAYTLCGLVIAASAGANRFTSVTFNIPYYANTTNYKAFHTVFAGPYSTTAATYRMGSGGGLWPVANAITRILVWTGTGAGEFATGSMATLYGLD